jgi:hypothetical protein
MCNRAFILVLIVAICGAAFVRVRSLAHGRGSRLSGEPLAAVHDVGAAMRQITGTDAAGVKPWVIDDVAFRNAHPDRQWIVGRSERPATSESDAMASARADAARRLAAVVRSRVHGWIGDPRWLQSRVGADVDSGRLDADTFVERFDRPYGTVYSGAVLLDASADRIEPVTQSARRELAARHRRAGMHAAIAGALLIFTWIGYALLNSVTRGYLTTRLRAIAAAVTIGILILA